MPEPSPRDFLAAAGWLSTVSPALRSAILAAGRLRELDPGEQFHVAGDERVGMWGLAAGQIGLTSAMNGPDQPVGFINHPGEWGGYGPLFGSPRQANAVARTAAIVLFVPYDALRQMLAEHPEWWVDFARLALFDVYRFGSWGADLLQKDSRARTAAVLLHQAGCRRAGDKPVTVAVAQGELGDMANLSRHPIANILHDFETNGWIACGYRKVEVLDAAALRSVADCG